MSSSEKAKTPATFEERNPFDISRHSGPEVAAEIAKRMAALKTARARTYTAPTTVPGPDAKPAPIAAPVQPARVPKAAAQPAPSARSAETAAPRVPYFASASAIRRAMPPAPSLKQRPRDQPSPVAPEPVAPSAAPMPDQAPPTDIVPALDPAPAVTAPATAEAPIAAPTPIDDSPLDAAVAEAPSEPAEPSQVLESSHPEVAHIDEKERIQAEARAIRARWIAAHDLESFIDANPAEGDALATSATEAPTAAAHHAEIDTPADEAHTAADAIDSVEPEGDSVLNTASDVDEMPTPSETLDEAALDTVNRHAASPAIHLTTLDEMAGRREPTFDMPEACAPPETAAEPPAPRVAAEPDVVPGPAMHLGTAALDGMSGRKEPTFEARAARATPEIAEQDEPDAAADIGIAALDEMAGRKEPTFDGPVRRLAPEIAPAAPAPQPPHADELAYDAALEEKQAAVDLPRLDTARFDHAAARTEPAPGVEPKPAAKIVAPRITMRPIETRIEARRIDTLRAEPELSAARPMLSHDEAEDWDMPPTLAAKAGRARRGTGWAIGLGSVLLIAGITAPAAIWQQGRQDQDRVALVTPAPAPQQAGAAAPAAATTTAPTPAPMPALATLPAAPQADVADAAPVSESPASEPPAKDFATELKTIGDGVEVEAAPVMTPPPPAKTLASAGPAVGGTYMVARPFVPESGDGPFLRAPAGMTPMPPAGAKPALVVQLKPKVTAKPSVSKPKPVARQAKPFFQQSPDQMFDTLIGTLSKGKPANPATKPQSPSTRR